MSDRVARAEDEGSRLGRTVLVSDPFARAVGRRTVALGDFELDGIAGPQPVYGVEP